tara:strand:+ start:669 stop:770 length:102 start_codon:yes stop_codon:yes gene_type:complete
VEKEGGEKEEKEKKTLKEKRTSIIQIDHSIELF